MGTDKEMVEEDEEGEFRTIGYTPQHRKHINQETFLKQDLES